jgi:hypothetical protein
VFIKTVSKLVIIGCFVFICQNNQKPTELIQVGFTILFIKKTGLFLTFNFGFTTRNIYAS